MKCQYCGNDVPAGSQNCPSCGAAAPQPVPYQQPVGAGPQPGAQNIPANYPKKTRIAYILLGIFLGFFGVHNFYAGYYTKGIIQLLVSLFLGWLVIPCVGIFIWAVIEIATVDVDANGIKMD